MPRKIKDEKKKWKFKSLTWKKIDFININNTLKN